MLWYSGTGTARYRPFPPQALRVGFSYCCTVRVLVQQYCNESVWITYILRIEVLYEILKLYEYAGVPYRTSNMRTVNVQAPGYGV